MKTTLLNLFQKWWFWLCLLIMFSVPKYQGMSATGEYWDCGFPFPALHVKRGHMGTGGTFDEGVLYVPDGTPPLAGNIRQGWFIQANPLPLLYDFLIVTIALYGASRCFPPHRTAAEAGNESKPT